MNCFCDGKLETFAERVLRRLNNQISNYSFKLQVPRSWGWMLFCGEEREKWRKKEEDEQQKWKEAYADNNVFLEYYTDGKKFFTLNLELALFKEKNNIK